MNILIFLKHLFLDILKAVSITAIISGVLILFEFLITTFGPEVFIIAAIILIVLGFIIVDAIEKTEKEQREKEREAIWEREDMKERTE